MSIEKDIKEAGLDEVLKGLAKLSSGYLALRIREVEAESRERESALRKQIDDLRTRVDLAAKAFADLKRDVNNKLDRPVLPTNHRE